MTDEFPPSIDRLYALLADRATQGLTPAEEAELAGLLTRWPHVEDDAFDLAAAAAAAALAPAEDPPPGLADAVLRAAPAHLPLPRERRPGGWGWAAGLAGWGVAAGLAGAMVVFRPPGPPTPADRLAALRADGTAARFAGAAGPDVRGEVVWSPGRQEGVLEVRGLRPNDPARAQYQLWIVDAGRADPAHPQPVDGGVFDVGPDGAAVVPVKAALRVFAATAFAVTAEPPGGVVVSAGPRLLVLTPAGG